MKEDSVITADIRKEGSRFDLPIAAAILAAAEIIPAERVADTMIAGKTIAMNAVPSETIQMDPPKAETVRMTKTQIPSETIQMNAPAPSSETGEEQAADQKTFDGYYHTHYCQVKNIKGRQHYIIYTDIKCDNGIIGSRVGHGKLLEEADPREQLVPLSFVCRNVRELQNPVILIISVRH